MLSCSIQKALNLYRQLEDPFLGRRCSNYRCGDELFVRRAGLSADWRSTGVLPMAYALIENEPAVGDTEALSAPLMASCWSDPYANMAAAIELAPTPNRLDSLDAPLEEPPAGFDAEPAGD